jgi:hypothetical protein
MTLTFLKPARAFFIILLFLGFLLSGGSVSAQSLPCGNIVGPEILFNHPNGDYDNIVTEEIDDCEDPFNVTIDPPSIYSLEIDLVEVRNGYTYVQNQPIQRINVLGRRAYTDTQAFLFKHESNDYIFVDQQVPEPTVEEYRNFASSYFGTEAEADQYMTILIESFETGNIDQYLFDESGEYLMDENTGQSVLERYDNFQSAANNYLYGRAVTYEAGTYTALVMESQIHLTQNSFW